MTYILFPLVGRPGERGDASLARPGGADWSALTLARYLGDQGITPIVSVQCEGPTMDYVESLGLECINLDFRPISKQEAITPEKLGELEQHAARVETMLSQRGIDLVHTNDATIHRTWGFLKLVIGFQQLWHERGLFHIPAAAEPVAEAVEGFVTISQFVKRRAPKDIAARCEVVDDPVEIDLDQFDRAADARWLRKEFGLPQDAPVFTMIANENLRKRWDLFFKAAVQAIQKNADMQFISLGLSRKSEMNKFRRSIPQELRRNIVFAGYRMDALRVISGSTALISTARDEPLGRTIIEAGLLKTPMMVSDMGGHHELLSDLAPECLVEGDKPMNYAQRWLQYNDVAEAYASNAEGVKSEFMYRFNPKRHSDQIKKYYDKTFFGGDIK